MTQALRAFSRLHRRPSTEPSENGSVLLLTLIATSMVALLTLSFQYSVREQLALSRDNSAALQAELAAESGIDYAARQLRLDSMWNGTGPDGIAVDGLGKITIQRMGALPTDPFEQALVQLLISGASEDSLCQIQTDIELDPSFNIADLALIGLGNETDIHDTEVHGNMALTEGTANVVAYDEVVGDWIESPATGNEQYVLHDSSVFDGTLYKFSETDYGQSEELVLPEPLKLPVWNLDEYLVPGPDRVIFSGVEDVANMVLEETAVFILAPNATLRLSNVDFRGGAVIHVPASYDVRGGPRNKVVLRDSCMIGGGSGGAHPSIGILAPGAEVTSSLAVPLSASITGVNFWHSTGQVHNLEVQGQLIVINDISQLKVARITYDADIAQNPPIGVDTSSPFFKDLDMVIVRESY